MLYSDIQFIYCRGEDLSSNLGFSLLSLDFFLHFLTFCLISDDWNPVMEH